MWFSYLLLNESVGERVSPAMRSVAGHAVLTARLPCPAVSDSYQDFRGEGAHAGGHRQDPFQVGGPCSWSLLPPLRHADMVCCLQPYEPPPAAPAGFQQPSQQGPPPNV